MSARPDLRTAHAADFTMAYLVDVLRREQLLTEEQARRAIEQESLIRARLMRANEQAGTPRGQRQQVEPTEILAAFEFHTANGRPISEDVIMQAVARDVDMAFEKPDPLKLDMELITRTMTRPFARHNSCVPLRKEQGAVVIAIVNPFNKMLIEQLHHLTTLEIKLVLSAKSDIQRIITEVYGFRSSVAAAEQKHGGSTSADVGNLEQLTSLSSLDGLEATDRPVVNAVEYLLHYALDQRASDIHIEPKRERTVVRLRIDGILHNVYALPKPIHAPLTSRLKMLARMDISEKRRSQDGRIKLARQGGEVELRVSSMLVAFGEKLVIRVFDPESLIQGLDEIGFYPEELDRWRGFVHRPHGMVLVTGPTGSGKTTTLYSTLQELAGPERNITTVEDPIEMVYEDFNQVLVQRRIDITFAAALRTILRQDPDVVMIGEIRDQETAKMATQAALTGHLVLSTLHTNDTSSTVTRMLDFGVEPFMLGTTLVGVMAQRLMRRICTHCKARTLLTPQQIEALQLPVHPRSGESLATYYGEGCLRCRNTGYFGRTGAFELLRIDDSVRRVIMHHGTAAEIRAAARANGMISLRESATRKLAQGVTTFDEVIRATADS